MLAVGHHISGITLFTYRRRYAQCTAGEDTDLVANNGLGNVTEIMGLREGVKYCWLPRFRTSKHRTGKERKGPHFFPNFLLGEVRVVRLSPYVFFPISTSDPGASVYYG